MESPEGEAAILAEKSLCSYIPFLFSNINRLQKNESNQLHCCDQLLRTNSHPCCLHPAAVIQLQRFRAGLAEITLCTQGPQVRAPPPELSVESWELCSQQLPESQLWNTAIHFGSTYLLHQGRVPDSNCSFPQQQTLWSNCVGKEFLFFT